MKALRRNHAQIGKLAQSNGKEFEDLFSDKCWAMGIACTRVPDGCKTVGRGRLVRVKAPFDWFLSHLGRGVALLDTKNWGVERVMPSNLNRNQYDKMLPHWKNGAVCGFVIHFRPLNEVRFLSVAMMGKIFQEKKGVHASECFLLGDIRTFEPSLILSDECNEWIDAATYKGRN